MITSVSNARHLLGGRAPGSGTHESAIYLRERFLGLYKGRSEMGSFVIVAIATLASALIITPVWAQAEDRWRLLEKGEGSSPTALTLVR